jgi:hypothetical protein
VAKCASAVMVGWYNGLSLYEPLMNTKNIIYNHNKIYTSTAKWTKQNLSSCSCFSTYLISIIMKVINSFNNFDSIFIIANVTAYLLRANRSLGAPHMVQNNNMLHGLIPDKTITMIIIQKMPYLQQVLTTREQPSSHPHKFPTSFFTQPIPVVCQLFHYLAVYLIT